MSLESLVNRETRSSKRHKTGSIEVVDVEAFCFTPISHKGTDKSNSICVEHYTHDRDIHLAIQASLALSNPTPRTLIELSDSDADDDDDVRILRFKPGNTPFGKRRRNSEKGESSSSSNSNNNSTPFVCEICTETKTQKDSFSISGCSHAYCTECVIRYVGSKMQENVINIRCPVSGCRGLLEPEDCRAILPSEVFDRWGSALCEAVILTTEKFYCPFKDCSALMIDDGKEVIKESVCPSCRRLFCVQCKVPWHSGIDCEVFQKLNKDEREMEDVMLMQLAQSKKWRRCPMCRFYVEKSIGCKFMRCRCGIAFCYDCGALSRHNTHYCFNCRR